MTTRNRAWADTLIDNTVVNGGQLRTDLLIGAPTIDTITAVRIVGDIMGFSGALSEAEGTQLVDLGIGVTSREAFDALVLPDPNASGDYPPRGWLYVARAVMQTALPTGATPTAIFRRFAEFHFDVRSMRKIDKGVLFMVISNTNADGGTETINLAGRVRVLCLT